MPIKYSIFTKPWKNESAEELAALVKGLGFDGVEFPLRDGYQVEPKSASTDLPKLAQLLDGYGIGIFSVASTAEENVFEACAAAKVPVIRIMLKADLKKGYMACEDEWKSYLSGLLPLCEKYGVKVAVQHHYGPGVNNSMELRHLLEGFPPALVGGIWDAAHSGLAGEEPEQGLDIAWSHLAMVNFKNAFYRRATEIEADIANYEPYFTTGKKGACDWKRASDYLKARRYSGVICLPAEYTDEANTGAYVREDLAYLKSLMA